MSNSVDQFGNEIGLAAGDPVNSDEFPYPPKLNSTTVGARGRAGGTRPMGRRREMNCGRHSPQEMAATVIHNTQPGVTQMMSPVSLIAVNKMLALLRNVLLDA
jgi:hypothetical protein